MAGAVFFQPYGLQSPAYSLIMENNMTTREQDIRVEILNALLTTPHRELEKICPVHRELIGKDPRFYVRLAAWYHDNGDVRDHKEMFIVNLVLSEFPGHRDVGLAMLRGLPPYQVVRVVDFISGRKKTRKLRKDEGSKTVAKASKRVRRSLARKLFGTAKSESAEVCGSGRLSTARSRKSSACSATSREP